MRGWSLTKHLTAPSSQAVEFNQQLHFIFQVILADRQ